MAYDPNDSGEFIRPLPQYMDNLIVEHPVIGQCELWKAIAWDTAQLRNYKMKRADSAGAVDQNAGQSVKQPPPLVADSSKAKDKAATQTKIQSALDVLDGLERRLDVLEEKKRRLDAEAECTRRAEAALALAEEIAEVSSGHDARRAPSRPETEVTLMPIKDVCSPNSSGQKPKPQPFPHPDKDKRNPPHARVYGDRRGDQVQPSSIGPVSSSSTRRGP